MNSRRLIASLKAQDKAPFRLSLAHRTKLQSGHSNSAGREILHPLMNGHEQALPDEAGPASCTTRFTKQFKRLVNSLNLRKNIKQSRWHTFGTGRLIHDDTGRGLVQGALSVARLSEVSRFGSFVEPMADWFQ